MTHNKTAPQRVSFPDLDSGLTVPLGTLITRVRRMRGLSQREIQRRAGMKDSTLSKLESGTNGISSVSSVVKLADALEMPRQQLFEWAVSYIENKTKQSADRAHH
ncbi:helix-turn-helix domain-containing protein [Amycolatopsis sp. WAC 01375]|uniref:helix-turn-helix domain-containing protein n=1 Tax=Amycolatopsis sp. WAC 01375 TaxID=2203194 RepID=UPI0013156298|nr:helix-turn-helix transcriptional regulator [Amycolatopsis sp. WAC 01375]